MLKNFRVAMAFLAVATLTVGAITGIGVLPASAASVDTTIDGITYTAESDATSAGATVSSYSGVGGEIVIPATVTIDSVSYAVTAIGDRAFFCGEVVCPVTKVTFPETLTSIAGLAFADNQLTTLTIPNAVTTIGALAFQGNKLTSLTIGDSVISIDRGAFASNQLTSVSIPNSVTSIGESAFAYNELATVSIGNGVATIGSSAFTENRLATVSIPDSVTSIGNVAFGRNQLTTLSLGSGVTSIGEDAFSNNQLTTVSIPNLVTTIGDGAFYNNQLATVTIGASVQTVGDFAFCDNLLTAVTIPHSVKTIGAYAFNRNSLSTVTIPGSVTALGNEAFSQNLLTTVLMAGAAPVISAASAWGPFADGTGLTIYYDPARVSDYGSSWQGYTTAPAGSGAYFDANGHGTNPPIQLWIANSSAPAIAPADPSAGEFTFHGWYTAAIGGTRWDFTTTVTGFTTLYAQWGIVFTASAAPTVIGVAKVGETLTAHVGKWTPAPTLNYAWKQVGSNTVLGTEPTYVPTATDVAHALTVTVTGTKSGYQTTLRTSVATSVVVAGTFTVTPTPVISGTKQVGKVLLADAGEWPDSAVLTYAWKRVGSSGVLGTSYRYSPVAADVGKKLTVTVTATLAGYTSASKVSAQTTAVVAGVLSATPVPTIAGTNTAGETLTAVTGTWASGTTFTYVWKRASTATGAKTTITGATKRTYVLATADKGKYLTVTVVASKAGYTSNTQTSAGKKIAS